MQRLQLHDKRHVLLLRVGRGDTVFDQFLPRTALGFLLQHPHPPISICGK